MFLSISGSPKSKILHLNIINATMMFKVYSLPWKVSLKMVKSCICVFSVFTEGDNVEVDESLFQDMDDLDLAEEDIDIED